METIVIFKRVVFPTLHVPSKLTIHTHISTQPLTPPTIYILLAQKSPPIYTYIQLNIHGVIVQLSHSILLQPPRTKMVVNWLMGVGRLLLHFVPKNKRRLLLHLSHQWQHQYCQPPPPPPPSLITHDDPSTLLLTVYKFSYIFTADLFLKLLGEGTGGSGLTEMGDEGTQV